MMNWEGGGQIEGNHKRIHSGQLASGSENQTQDLLNKKEEC